MRWRVWGVLGSVLRGILGVVMWVGATGLCALVLPQAGEPFTAMAVVVVLIGVAVCLHEFGHYLGARLMGMRVLRVCVGPIDILPQRSGFRWRWRRSAAPRLAGFVYALPAPDRMMRPAFLVHVAGGPAANLIAALLGLSAALPWWPASGVGIALAFALINLAIALINLIPHSGKFVSDGMHLLVWLRMKDERAPDLALTRVLSLGVHGTPADRLPPCELVEMERQQQPAPLYALWYRLKASQNLGDWDATPALVSAFDAQWAVLAPALRSALHEFTHQMRSELAFSEAVRLRDAAPLRACALPLGTGWLVPALQPRIDALHALLAGDLVGCGQALDTARQHAEKDIDAALASSEARIATVLRARFGVAASSKDA